jgi:hypothetical protein
MITRNALRAIALATSCLAPMVAYAQAPASAGTPAVTIGGTPFTGEFGLGLMGVTGQNADQAGRYSGLNTTGIDLLGNFSLTGRDPWNSGGTRYYEFEGNNLVYQAGSNLGSGVGSSSGFGSSTTNAIGNEAYVGFRTGNQGTWGIGGYYNAITYTGNVIDSLYTVNGSTAYLNNNLAPWGGATGAAKGAVTAFTVPQLQSSGALLPVQTGVRRDIVGGDFKYKLGSWTFSGVVRHEHKEGSMEETYDGMSGGMAFAMPVDYDTDRYDAIAAYNSRLYQGVFQYTFSHFTDNNLFVSLPYPTSNTASPYQRTAAYALPPSNSAQYVTMMLATNAIPETRVNLNARVGVEKQDSTFAPNTADPAAASLRGTTGFLNLNPMLQGTTEDSPDITATVYQMRVSANSHPMRNTDINAFYGVDGRNVTLNQYGIYGSGTGSDSSPSSATPYAFVVPQDWFKQNAGADVTYKIVPQYNTRVTLGYRLDLTDHSNAQVGHSSTNTASLGLMSDFGPKFNGKVSLDYADRSGTLSYLTPWMNLTGPTATPTWSGAYYQAPMTSEAVTVRADYEPTNTLSTDLFLQFKNEDYTYPSTGGYGATAQPLTHVGTGVKEDYALSVGPDINYRPTKSLNFHAYYTYELLFYNNLGNGNCATSNTGTCLGSAGYYQNKDTSSTHTVGLSGEWRVNEKLKIKADYTLSYGTVMFGQFNGVFVAAPTASYQNVTNYPDIDSLMNSLQITATYTLTPNIELVAQGSYVSFHTNNWNDDASAVQGAGTTTISILTPGYGSPTYSIGMLMGGMRVRF